MRTPTILALFAGLSASAFAFNHTTPKGTCSAPAALSVQETKNVLGVAEAAGSFKTLVTAVRAAGLVDALSGEGPFTVFAPTDEAFAKLPKGTLESLLKPENKKVLQTILTYHVVPGRVLAKDVVKLDEARALNGQRIPIEVGERGVDVAGVRVSTTDVLASNGVIHIVDAVMMPNTDDILTTATKAGSFTTLAAAIEAAGLVETLQGKGPFTVFAPTDEAFAALPEGALADLLKPENKERLGAVLKLHVVSGRVSAREAIKAGKAKSLGGTELPIVKNEAGDVTVHGAKVVTADLDTTNGVIHVIDRVLLP
ncbi:MAG: fasciclin domain-containing protein [Planctomycetaceae bacterium]|nr:fasciclin domain-containing protein [Planctomycetaceae bacterium]